VIKSGGLGRPLYVRRPEGMCSSEKSDRVRKKLPRSTKLVDSRGKGIWEVAKAKAKAGLGRSEMTPDDRESQVVYGMLL